MGGTTETRPATGSQGTASRSCHRHSRRSPSSSRRRGARRLPAIACRGAPGHTRADRNHLGPLPSKKNSPRTLQAREALRRSEEHTSELQSHSDLVCRLLLEKKKKNKRYRSHSY